MKKTCRLTLSLSALLALACAAGCGSNTETKTEPANRPAANTAAGAPAQTPAQTPTPATDPAAAVLLATPTEAYKTAHAMRAKKDVDGLKRVMSKDALEFFEMIAEGEKRTVEDELKQMMERPQSPSAETRNEKITGDRATLEYLDEKGAWRTMDFVKEGGQWKLTIPKAQ